MKLIKLDAEVIGIVRVIKDCHCASYPEWLPFTGLLYVNAVFDECAGWIGGVWVCSGGHGGTGA